MADFDFETEFNETKQKLKDLLTKEGMFQNSHRFSVAMSIFAIVLYGAEHFFGLANYINAMWVMAPLLLDIAGGSKLFPFVVKWVKGFGSDTAS